MAQQQIQDALKKLDVQLSQIPALVDLEKKTQVPKTNIVLGGVGSIITLGLLACYGDLVSNLIGFAYPAYRSFKAIESNDKRDDTQWLIYWVVFGFLNLFESFYEDAAEKVPLYYYVKVVVLLYLYLPQTQGAVLIYSKIRPYVIRYIAPESATTADKIKFAAGDAKAAAQEKVDTAAATFEEVKKEI